MWPTLGFKGRTVISSGFSAEGSQLLKRRCMGQVRQKIEQEISGCGWSMHGYIPSYSWHEREKRSPALGSQQMGLQFLHPQYQTVGCSKECVVLEANSLKVKQRLNTSSPFAPTSSLCFRGCSMAGGGREVSILRLPWSLLFAMPSLHGILGPSPLSPANNGALWAGLLDPPPPPQHTHNHQSLTSFMHNECRLG